MNLILSVCVVLSYAVLVAGDYCNRTLCGNSVHIGCNNNGAVQSACESKSQFIDLTQYKTDIVHIHNENRNLVASGKLYPYSPAGRMATIQWDDELAYLAGLNVKTCNYGHDSCRNTNNFKYSGQNLAWWKGYPAQSVEQAYKQAIRLWFNEYPNTDMSVINKFRSSNSRTKQYGHFTVMVADRNTRVGCAMLKTVDGRYTQYVTACNYATTNMIGQKIYAASRSPASECQQGNNPKYTSLCSVNEKYDVNNFF